jgi:hypothetical protein
VILREDEIAAYYPDWDVAADRGLWLAAETAVKRICRRTFESGSYTEYPHVAGGKLYPEEPPIAAAGLSVVIRGSTDRTLTADTGIGKLDKDYFLMNPGAEGSYVDLHGSSYDHPSVQLNYTGGYTTGTAPESVKAAVGVAMGVLRNMRDKGGASAVNWQGE